MISYDGPSKTIQLSAGTTLLGVRDVYSRWVDWFLTGDNSKYLPAFDCVGGNVIDSGAGTSIPIYGFLTNGWRIRPQEANHTLNVVDGILLVDGGGDPFLDTVGGYNVRINYQQPVQAIAFSSEGAGITPADIWAYASRTLSAEGISGVQSGLATSLSVSDLRAVVDMLVKLAQNKAVVSQDRRLVTIYDDDKVGVVKEWDISADGLSRDPR